MTHEPIVENIEKAEAVAKKTSASRGERFFDWLTYGGIAGIGAFALTIPTTYWAKYGGGATMFRQMAQKLTRKGIHPHAAEDIVMTTALMQGGNLAIPPVKLMENYKPQLVDKFNDMLGDKSGEASVQEDPQQTWGSLIKSRIAAWLAVFAGFRGAASIFGGEKFAQFETKFAESVICKPLGRPTHINGQETKLFRYGKIAALDLFATAAAASLLYLGSRFFAKRNPHWHAHMQVPEGTSATEHSQQDKDKVPPEKTGADAAAPETAQPGRLFTDSIQPQAKETRNKPRVESFAETVAGQKTAAPDIAPGLNA
jgi:hypothetical protein